MMIDNFRIKIKKYDRTKQVVIANIIVSEIIEMRGFVIRYAELKKSPYTSQWIVNPPSVKIRGKSNKYFWMINILDTELWHQLQKKIIVEVKKYTDY